MLLSEAQALQADIIEFCKDANDLHAAPGVFISGRSDTFCTSTTADDFQVHVNQPIKTTRYQVDRLAQMIRVLLTREKVTLSAYGTRYSQPEITIGVRY